MTAPDDDHGERLARIETKLDLLLGRHDDQEKRIRSLEAAKAWLMGAAAVAGAAGDKIASHLPKLI